MEDGSSILALSDELLVHVCSYLSHSADLLQLSKGNMTSIRTYRKKIRIIFPKFAYCFCFIFIRNTVSLFPCLSSFSMSISLVPIFIPGPSMIKICLDLRSSTYPLA